MGLFKHEIAKVGARDADVPLTRDGLEYQFYKADLDSSIILPSGLTDRGSYTWHCYSKRLKKMVWVERRQLANEMLSAFASS